MSCVENIIPDFVVGDRSLSPKEFLARTSVAGFIAGFYLSSNKPIEKIYYSLVGAFVGVTLPISLPVLAVAGFCKFVFCSGRSL